MAEVKISRSRSSAIGLTGSASSSVARRQCPQLGLQRDAPPGPARARARIRSIARLRAAVTIHAAGLSGTPSRGQRSSATSERVLHRLLGAVEVAEDAREDGDRLPRLAPEQAVDDVAAWRPRPLTLPRTP